MFFPPFLYHSISSSENVLYDTIWNAQILPILPGQPKYNLTKKESVSAFSELSHMASLLCLTHAHQSYSCTSLILPLNHFLSIYTSISSFWKWMDWMRSVVLRLDPTQPQVLQVPQETTLGNRKVSRPKKAVFSLPTLL